MTYFIKNPWEDGRNARVVEKNCQYYHCLNIGENKGTYVNGRGYTSYYDKPELVCLTNHIHGCPINPGIDWASVFCCDSPEFSTCKNNRVAIRQKCKRCGKWVNQNALTLIKEKQESGN